MLAAGFAHANVVARSNISLQWDDLDIATYSLTIFQDEAATDPTSLFSDYESSTISNQSLNADESSDWYLVEEFDEFSEATIIGDVHPILARLGSALAPADVVVGGDFFPGVNTGVGFDPFSNEPERDVFGWVHLQNQFGELVMIDNAVTYMGSGIIVGTTTVIPEPSLAQLLGVCALAAGLQRRR